MTGKSSDEIQLPEFSVAIERDDMRLALPPLALAKRPLRLVSIVKKVKQALRGDVDPRHLAIEMSRRGLATLQHKRERAMLKHPGAEAPRLAKEFRGLSHTRLLEHFRSREIPAFLPGLSCTGKTVSNLQQSRFPEETQSLLKTASLIVDEHKWTVLGYGERSFGAEIDWNLDPLSGNRWPARYHRDISFFRGDGSDARVMWEVNRLGHFITLGRAFSVTGDERFAEEFFNEIRSWNEQNPVGLTVNWSCAMEAALRAINILAALQLFRSSRRLNETGLMTLLTICDQHAAHIRRNLEFSYLSTSNHYLSDVVGLLWLGIMLPELEGARKWREFGLHEMLREMDKQVLEDGADYEASTGYHRLVTEMFLYTFVLCRENHIEIHDRYWGKLHAMLEYLRGYLRPDGLAPLIGDTDSGQVLPIVRRRGNDHSYLLAVGAVVFNEPLFKNNAREIPPELLWIMGEKGLRQYDELAASESEPGSAAFTDAGIYIQRDRELYLLFNAGGNGLFGRGSHGHNDALSLEVCDCGTPFIIDPGTYVYSADLAARHMFRSTSYHSTVEIDGLEQNSTDEQTPFVLGDEAHPEVVKWETSPERDVIIAEHRGYLRLDDPVIHRRSVTLDKYRRIWIVEDSLTGSGEHVARFRFHMSPGLELTLREDRIVHVLDRPSGASLFLAALDVDDSSEFEPRFSSTDYGEKTPSVSVCWKICARLPLLARWALIPVCRGEDCVERLSLIDELKS